MSIATVLSELGKIKPAVGRCDQALTPTAQALARIEAKVLENEQRLIQINRLLLEQRG